MQNFFTFIKNFWSSFWVDKNIIKLSDAEVKFTLNFLEKIRSSCNEMESEIETAELAQKRSLEWYRNRLDNDVIQKEKLIKDKIIKKSEIDVFEASLACYEFIGLREILMDNICSKKKIYCISNQWIYFICPDLKIVIGHIFKNGKSQIENPYLTEKIRRQLI